MLPRLSVILRPQGAFFPFSLELSLSLRSGASLRVQELSFHKFSLRGKLTAMMATVSPTEEAVPLTFVLRPLRE